MKNRRCTGKKLLVLSLVLLLIWSGMAPLGRVLAETSESLTAENSKNAIMDMKNDSLVDSAMDDYTEQETAEEETLDPGAPENDDELAHVEGEGKTERLLSGDVKGTSPEATEEDDEPDEKPTAIKEQDISDVNKEQVKTEDDGVSALFAGGDGSLKNPYLIETAEQLNAIRNDLNAHYQLIGDIDLSRYSSGEGWKSIGDRNNPFNGTFDGQGHIITGLIINHSIREHQGLFGTVITGGKIENVFLKEVKVGEFNNSFYQGIGGLVGLNYGEINNSYVTGTILGYAHLGGLVGVNYGQISKSYFSGTVSGDMYVGGLVGSNMSEVNKSYSSGKVSGNMYVGGLVGLNSGVISDSYVNGQTLGNTRVDGLVGYNSGTVSRSYWNRSANETNPPMNGIGTPVKEKEMKQRETYEGWDFTNTWFLYNGVTMPFLQWENPLESMDAQIDDAVLDIGDSAQIKVTAHHQNGSFDGTHTAEYTITKGKQIVEVDTSGHVTAKAPGEAVITVTLHDKVSTINMVVDDPLFAGGNGTLKNPYLIETAEQLNAIRNDLNAHYQLIGDIDLSGYSWEPIGDWNNGFEGTFDGHGHVITGLTVNHIGNEAQGMFKSIGPAGIIKNVSLKNVEVGEKSYWNFNVGGLTGVNNGKISQSSVTGTVMGNQYVGGLAGVNKGEINESYFKGTINGGEYGAGGLVGMNDGKISESYAEGLVSVEEVVGGGLVGSNSKEISESYFTGTVTGRGYIGGLVGISGSGTGSSHSSYWNISKYDDTQPPNNSIGKPVTEDKMKQRETYEGWDFTNTWFLYNGVTMPFLQWENPLESMDVQIDDAVLDIGDSAQIKVTAHHQNGSFDGTHTAEYTVTKGGKTVEVDTSGHVTAKAPGEAVITVTLHGKFSTIEVTIHPYKIKSVEHPDSIAVVNGTAIDKIDLPDTIEVTLSPDDSTREVAVAWTDADGGRSYQPTVPGTYTFIGTFVDLPEDITNPDNLKATINVVVGNPFITEIASLEDINVANGTDRSALHLPGQIKVRLSNGSVLEVPVTWDDGNPKYDGMKAGSYTFIGTLDLPENVLNPDRLTGIINVTVLDKVDTGENSSVDQNTPSGKVPDDNQHHNDYSSDILPETANPYLTAFLVGVFLILAGGVLVLFIWKRKRQLAK